LGWLHSHTDAYLSCVTLNMARRAFNTSSIAKWLSELEEAGFLAITKGGSGKADSYALDVEAWVALFHRRRHRADTGPANAANRAETGAPGPACIEDQSENTSTNASVPSEPSRAAVAEATPRQRPRDELFDAMTEACGIIQSEMTRTLHGQASKAVMELRKAGATPDEVARRADVYRSLYPDNTLTPAALCKHWAMVREVRAPATRHGTSNAVSALREHMAAKAA
jgi:hypothetical protein